MVNNSNFPVALRNMYVLNNKITTTFKELRITFINA